MRHRTTIRFHSPSSLALLLSLALTPLLSSGRPPAGPAPTAVPIPGPTGAGSDDEPANPLAWLVGRWVGEGLGGEVEESWQPPMGGVMLGTFRLVVDGRPVFYELMTIGGLGENPTMGLKHFEPSLASWEEKDESLVWPATVLEEDRVAFGPVHYERTGEDSMIVAVELGGSEPQELSLRRAGP